MVVNPQGGGSKCFHIQEKTLKNTLNGKIKIRASFPEKPLFISVSEILFGQQANRFNVPHNNGSILNSVIINLLA